MALLSTLVERIADVEGIDKVHASGVARYLREAGYISQAGRGRGAAKMTNKDAAYLVIGLNVAKIAKDSPAEVEFFSCLTNIWNNKSNFFGICEHNATLINDTELIIKVSQDVNVSQFFTGKNTADNKREIDIVMSFMWPEKYARITIQETIYDQDGVPETDELASALYGSVFTYVGKGKTAPDRSETISISHKTFLAIAETLRS